MVKIQQKNNTDPNTINIRRLVPTTTSIILFTYLFFCLCNNSLSEIFICLFLFSLRDDRYNVFISSLLLLLLELNSLILFLYCGTIYKYNDVFAILGFTKAE